MLDFNSLLVIASTFFLISISAGWIGDNLAKIKFPIITGFLLTGILAGPYVLGIISTEAARQLAFVDKFALGFIAFSAGSELYLKDIWDRINSIKWTTICLSFFTFTLGTIATFFLTDYIPFTSVMSHYMKFAVSLLSGSVLVAISPSSAIATVKELRAKGPFTKTVLGVTIIIDIVVIFLFAFSSSIADAIFSNISPSFAFFGLLILEIFGAFVLGAIISLVLLLFLSLHVPKMLRTFLVISVGYLTFVVSFAIRDYTHASFDYEILIEPLLICLIAGFLVTNFSAYRERFAILLHKSHMPIFIAFFTLTGASLTLDVISKIWEFTLILFFVRLGAIFIGSFTGGLIAKEPYVFNKISWMSYITQAGVGLGLAKEVAIVFPAWGEKFATMMVSIIILNQLVGPIFLKWALKLAKEAHVPIVNPLGKRGRKERFAVIFGNEGQALALAMNLRSHNWEVMVASTESKKQKRLGNLDIIPLSQVTLDQMRELGCDKARAIISMLPEDKNFNVCELAFEYFPQADLIAYVATQQNSGRYKELGAFIISPSTAIVSLMDHVVRSPSSASLLLGLDHDRDIIDIVVKNPNFRRVKLKDLKLPPNILVVSIHRNKKPLHIHGHTLIQEGDLVTVVGPNSDINDAILKFG
ncbi:MAG: cation:proton antiporter [Bacteriovoracaceae bacterium]|nr:cation:proton antiporter [Bacteriovoracaceae bacterium]